MSAGGCAERPVPPDLLATCALAAWMRWPSLDISREGSTAITLPGWPPYTWKVPNQSSLLVRKWLPQECHTDQTSGC